MILRLLIVLVLMAAAAQAASSRDAKQVYAFRKAHACPATQRPGMGACPGWVVNHIVPLCYGGADNPDNMEWEQRQPSFVRDTFERKLCKGQADD